MSRSGYSDDCDGWDLIRWRGAVASAIKGSRGQALLREMAAALDAMPVKRLVSDDLRRPDGDVCALGAVAVARGMDVSNLDLESSDRVAKAFGVAPALIREISFMNDDEFSYGTEEMPEQRWKRMRRWVDEKLITQERPGEERK